MCVPCTGASAAPSATKNILRNSTYKNLLWVTPLLHAMALPEMQIFAGLPSCFALRVCMGKTRCLIHRSLWLNLLTLSS